MPSSSAGSTGVRARIGCGEKIDAIREAEPSKPRMLDSFGSGAVLPVACSLAYGVEAKMYIQP